MEPDQSEPHPADEDVDRDTRPRAEKIAGEDRPDEDQFGNGPWRGPVWWVEFTNRDGKRTRDHGGRFGFPNTQMGATAFAESCQRWDDAEPPRIFLGDA